MSPEEIIDRFRDKQAIKKSEGTAQRYYNDVRAWHNWLSEEQEKSLWEVTTADLRLHLEGLLRDDYAPDTITVRRAAISSFYKDAGELKTDYGLEVEVPENPADDLDMSDWTALKSGTKKEKSLRQEVYYLKPEQIEQLEENVRTPQIRNRLLIRLCYQTGVRANEAASIRLQDIDREERSIRIDAQKTHQNRQVYFQRSLDLLLRQWLNGGYRNAMPTAEESEYLFCTLKAEKMHPSTVNEVVRDAAESAGLQEEVYTDNNEQTRVKVTTHVLRHSCAVQCVKNGMDIRTLQKFLGHAKLDTTEKYLHVTPDDVRDAARTFGAGTE